MKLYEELKNDITYLKYMDKKKQDNQDAPGG